MSRRSNKRTHSSTTSDFDSNTSALDNSQLFESPLSRKNRRRKKKKENTDKKAVETQTKLDSFVQRENSTKSVKKQLTMEQKIDEISKKLSKMLTKDDKLFIKEIIKDTLDEMKDYILGSVVKRIEILEGEAHTRAKECEKLQHDIKKKNEELEKVKEENTNLKEKLKSEELQREKEQNDLEQYGRRNNVRISGIKEDADKQQSATVAELVVKNLNDKGGLKIQLQDIDIAHRLGKWEVGKNRTIIVRFVRRQTKVDVMKQAKELRKKSVFVNEDLTRLNQQVLASLRLKDKANVTKCWSFEGKIFAVFNNQAAPTEIKYADFSIWLNKPWPKKAI